MDYVAIFMAWPYANGPLHLGTLQETASLQISSIGMREPEETGTDVQRFGRAGTPITITADEMGVSPQEVVDKYPRINPRH
ncbi:MAG: hypothetical protein Ct9H90mP24_1230 [Methanobacteriota archaeon]|nr:MAG: hypothetical protein Ct9H90mP24_1230 [Euryarchaeota archaeon]